VLTASLITGVVVSLILTELVGLSAGGIVVPGYVAMLLDRPWALAAFALVALASFALVRLLSGVLMLYGRRRFALTLLTGMVLSLLLQFQLQHLLQGEQDWAGLGFIVPGLLATQFDRQGVLATLAMVAIAAPIVRVIVLLAVRL
jgi:poly-gamma-glutamate biosynthesis protein PgsC/CapC